MRRSEIADQAPPVDRAHRQQSRNRKKRRDFSFLFTCGPCGKRTYPTRKEARRVARAVHPDDQLASYECPAHLGLFHIGHPTTDLRDAYRRSA